MPLDRRRLQVDGLEVAYRESGPPTAPTLFLVHGLASSSRMWIETMTALSPEYHCVALDLPGHGGSSTPPFTWYTIENYAGVCAALWRALSLEPVFLFGHSMGAMIVMQLAAQRAVAAGNVLVAPIFEGSELSYGNLVRFLTREPLRSLTFAVWRATVAIAGLVPKGIGSEPAARAERKRMDLVELDPRSALGSLRAIVDADLALDPQTLPGRALVVVGTGDKTGALEQGRRWAAASGRVDLLELPAGHHPFYEAPGEYRQALTSFLATAKVR